MQQPAIFVSYLPERVLEKRRATVTKQRAEPLVALLAGVFAIGGTIAVATPSLGNAAMPVGTIARVKLAQPHQAKPEDHRALAARTADASNRVAVASKAPKFVALRASDLTAKANQTSEGKRLETVTRAHREQPGLRPPTASVALSNRPLPGSMEVGTGVAQAQQAGKDAGASYPMVLIGDHPIGAITMERDRLHLASLVGLLKLKMPAVEFERLQTSEAANAFVTFDELRNAGIEATFDPARGSIALRLIDEL
ncbi:MAG: hypothetical protein EOO81_11330 [Oxalobacteraceae bacterium]|nr:MAG: hypothetical protein EOO81_11330 [Oxalobacteraceae bacterium]